MRQPSKIFASGTMSCGFVVLSALLAGCEKTEQIAVYDAPPHKTLQTEEFLTQYGKSHPEANRMLAVVIPRQEFLWFFKLEGEPAAVSAREVDVRSFLNSVRFPAVDSIDWNLPAGWQRLPGTQMRFATIQLDGQPALEMTVTKLPSDPQTPVIEQVLSNINRWRNQLSLPAIDEEDLPDQTEQLELNGSAAWWINIIGRPKPRPAGMQLPPQQAAQTERKTSESTGPKYETPAGWAEGRPNGVAVVSLQVADGTEKLAITVTSAGGKPLDNVNRWRGQLGLDSIGEEELARSAKKVPVGSLTGELYEMSNDQLAIFGAIVEDKGQSWFIKLSGNKGLAERERLRFEEFLKSLNWK